MTIEEEVNVFICIATYNREVGLTRLLNSLSKLRFIKCKNVGWQVVVVDNFSPKFPARQIVKEFQNKFPVPIIFGEETDRGIASTRNKAIALAKDCNFIVFTDDDQIVDPLWLDELLALQRETDADIVAGPVLPLFESTPPDWIIKGKFFDRKRYPTGTEIDYAGTGNMLIKRKWLMMFDGPFDVRLNLTGGSDTLYCRKVKDLGALIVWADDAITQEYNPPQRFTISWLLKRFYRMGTTLTLVDLWTQASIKTIALRLIKGIYHVLSGILLLIPKAIISGKAGIVRSLQLIVYGVGELIGFSGIKYKVY